MSSVFAARRSQESAARPERLVEERDGEVSRAEFHKAMPLLGLDVAWITNHFFTRPHIRAGRISSSDASKQGIILLRN